MIPANRPLSTYRLQLHAGFTFDDAIEVLPYLRDLGVSHVYCSPYLQAAPGSTHGYDVVDHSAVNAELGGEEGRRRFVAALRSHGLGQVLDIVPNHMSVAVPRLNRWWWDVLTHGEQSAYAAHFDIDWSLGRLLLPVLGDDGLAAVSVVEEDGTAMLAYHEHRFPIAPGTGAGGAAEVHDRQHYELAHWRRGREELGYRRFFDITDLAAVRVEESAVFELTHALPLQWLADGELDGLRVDHPDGLADPAAYAERLAERSGGAWVVLEKILEMGEALPPWPVAGTTGYDAMREVDALFVDPAGEGPLTDLYAELTAEPTDFAALVHDTKLRAATDALAAEMRRVGATLAAETALPVADCVAAVAEYSACLPVYRTYLQPAVGDLPDRDVALVRETVAVATLRRPDLAHALQAIAARATEPGEAAVRLQQTTGMVMAKGVEDTAFYRYHRLVSLNEVGGDPEAFGVGTRGPDQLVFHDACAERQRVWPEALTALSTHDTKRSADVRARLALLSEIPDEWGAVVRRWFDRYAPPDRNAAYLLCQTLVGAWPLSLDRTLAYVTKAVREAKQHTSWTDPEAAYERDLESYVRGLLDDATFVAEVEAFVARVAPLGRLNARSAALVQLTMPGVPDTYQGTEGEDLSLVDPDNRRPVDYTLRRKALAAFDAGLAVGEAELKIGVLATALRLRRARPDLLGPAASYGALLAAGSAAAHCVAFVRGRGAVTVVPRLVAGLARRGGWADTKLTLPPGRWRDLLGGSVGLAGDVRLADLLGDASPTGVALLVADT